MLAPNFTVDSGFRRSSNFYEKLATNNAQRTPVVASGNFSEITKLGYVQTA
jgi:hypothetical protein